MIRIVLALTVAVSFDVIALLIFVSAYSAPILSANIEFQRFVWTVIAFLVFCDLLFIYILFRPARLPHEEFEATFRRHFDGSNYEEAFRRAYEGWRRAGG